MKMKLCSLTLALATPLFAAGAAVAGGFTPPAGCETFLTVQMKSCRVSNFWRCEDAGGDVWEGAYDGGGPLSVSQYDPEFQWVSMFYATDGTRETLQGPGTDPISMSGLLDTGEDSFAFTMRSETGGETRMLHVEGRDRLTGGERTIDGVPLLEADTRVTIRDDAGEVAFTASGRQYVSRRMRMFFLGVDTARQDGESFTYDNTPVDFIFPGEPGFETTTPLYECNSVTSGLAAPRGPAKG